MNNKKITEKQKLMATYEELKAKRAKSQNENEIKRIDAALFLLICTLD